MRTAPSLRTAVAGLTCLAITLAIVSLFTAGSGLALLVPLPAVVTIIDRTRPPGDRARSTGTAVFLVVGIAAAGVVIAGGGDPIESSAWLTACCLIGLQVRAVTAQAYRACLVLAACATLLTLAVDPPAHAVAVVLAVWASVIAAVVLLTQHVRQGGDTPGTVTTAQVVGAPAPGSVATAGRRTIGPIGVVLALALAVFLSIPEPTGLNSVRSGGAGGPASAAATGRAIGGYTGGDLDLGRRGDLPDVDVARVPAASPTYWRMNVLDAYDGTTWRSTTTADETPNLRPAPADATYEVEPLRGYSGVLMAPGPVVAVTPRVGRTVGAHKSVQASVQPFAVTVHPYPGVGSTDAGVVSDSGADDPADPRWTQLPGSVSQRTRDLAVEIAGRGTLDPAAAATAVERYLTSGRYRYDLNAPTAPRGQDSVEHFLFTSRSGFCEHYAAAEVVLLRSLGVPARVATGFAGGTTSGGLRTINGKQAHAWVEVFVPGRGWVSSDATPADSPTRQLLSQHWSQRIIAGLLLAGVVAMLWFMRRRRTGPLVVAAQGDGSRDPLVQAVGRLLAAMEIAGVPNPPGQTMADTARVLPKAAEGLAVAERHLYGPRPVSRTELLAAVDALDAATAGLLTQSLPEPASPRG